MNEKGHPMKTISVRKALRIVSMIITNSWSRAHLEKVYGKSIGLFWSNGQIIYKGLNSHQKKRLDAKVNSIFQKEGAPNSLKPEETARVYLKGLLYAGARKIRC
jgi:hypothetical protein